ncbi:MAG: heavy-metal-associated domain-containing protein [Lachnospiraceae bacterium]|nr:heavy-metal-associated domain-containing protein [Lachnospiraceae bacterium]
MTNVIIILTVAVLMGLGIRHIYRSVRYGSSCCGSGSAMDKKIRVSDRNKANYPFSYKLRVDGMVCAGCVRKVENALNSDGELWATVDADDKIVRVLAKREMKKDDFLELLKETPYTLLEVE